MKYYKLYEIMEGKSREDKVEVYDDLSKKELETLMYLYKKIRPLNRYIIMEVNEKEVAST